MPKFLNMHNVASPRVAFHHDLLDYIMDQIQTTWKMLGFGDLFGPILILASDGDATRRRSLHQRTSATLPEGQGSLNGCGLLDQHTDIHGAMQCYDFKHNVKRVRTRYSTQMGQKISRHGLTLNRDTLTELFRVHDGDATATYQGFFNPDDK